MAIEYSQHCLHSEDVVKSRRKFVRITREKHIQRQQQGGNQSVSQTSFSTTHDLSVVIPTRNERDNILPLLELLLNALHDLRVVLLHMLILLNTS
jgi:hypothetical protein